MPEFIFHPEFLLKFQNKKSHFAMQKDVGWKSQNDLF